MTIHSPGISCCWMEIDNAYQMKVLYLHVYAIKAAMLFSKLCSFTSNCLSTPLFLYNSDVDTLHRPS